VAERVLHSTLAFPNRLPTLQIHERAESAFGTPNRSDPPNYLAAAHLGPKSSVSDYPQTLCRPVGVPERRFRTPAITSCRKGRYLAIWCTRMQTRAQIHCNFAPEVLGVLLLCSSIATAVQPHTFQSIHRQRVRRLQIPLPSRILRPAPPRSLGSLCSDPVLVRVNFA
jgi:hypothetical protein